MDDYTKRLVLCFSEKLDQAKVGYIEWNSFKLMAMVRTQVHIVTYLLEKVAIFPAVIFAESHFPAVWRYSQGGSLRNVFATV